MGGAIACGMAKGSGMIHPNMCTMLAFLTTDAKLSKKALEELKNAEKVLVKYKAKVKDIINYTLPLDEVYERNLIIIGF